MKVNAKSSNKKVAVVMAALSATLAFGGALAYLTDHDTKVNDIAFQQVDAPEGSGEEGLITLAEDRWEANENNAGADHAIAGILPGETLTKDPTIKINNWLTQAKAAGKNTPELNLFMRVFVPVEDVTGDGTPEELFSHTANAPASNAAGWISFGAATDLTVADGNPTSELPAGTYKVYRYYYGYYAADDANSADDEKRSLARAGAGTDVVSLFDSVTYIETATKAPSANRHIVVDAYAIQADNLGTSKPAEVYKLASGEAVTAA